MVWQKKGQLDKKMCILVGFQLSYMLTKHMEKTDLTYLRCRAVYKTCTLNEAVEHVILLVPETQEEKL